MSYALHTQGRATGLGESPILGRISFEALADERARSETALVLAGEAMTVDTRGYAAVLAVSDLPRRVVLELAEGGQPVVFGLPSVQHLETGDVVALHANGYVRTLYKRSSRHNALFVTDRCNSWCLMCSQPPRRADERGRLEELLRLVELIDPTCAELGVTGGEPTLLKGDLVRLIAACRDRLPSTALHVLSNGRLFVYRQLVREIAAIGHPELVFGVPVYSALDWAHDHVVQSPGAFNQTMVGLHHLAAHRVGVEIRVVVHRLNAGQLGELAEFLYRNLPFAAHVAFMGLEQMGFAVANSAALWIDPWEYRAELERAVLFLADRGLCVSVYNHPLCLLPPSLWSFSRASISDWKNDYLELCGACTVKERCGGFFSSSLKRRLSPHLQPISHAAA